MMTMPHDRFSILPSELLNIIYKDVLFSNHHSANSTTFAENQLALFGVSRQIHDEASSMFYSRCGFTIDILSPATAGATIFPPIADRHLSFLKRLTINVSTGCASLPRVQETARKIYALTEIGAAFAKIDIVIRGAEELSPLLNSRLDDSVLDMSHPITASLRAVLRAEISEVVRIQVTEGAWFAPGVASNIQATFGWRVAFLGPDQEVLKDVSGCERKLKRKYSSAIELLADESRSSDDSTADGSPSSSPPFSALSFNPYIGIESDIACEFNPHSVSDGESMLFGDMDLETESNEVELTSDDDLDDDEDLVSIADEEVEAIGSAWNDSVYAREEEGKVAAEMEFVVTFAPDLL